MYTQVQGALQKVQLSLSENGNRKSRSYQIGTDHQIITPAIEKGRGLAERHILLLLYDPHSCKRAIQSATFKYHTLELPKGSRLFTVPI